MSLISNDFHWVAFFWMNGAQEAPSEKLPLESRKIHNFLQLMRESECLLYFPPKLQVTLSLSYQLQYFFFYRLREYKKKISPHSKGISLSQYIPIDSHMRQFSVFKSNNGISKDCPKTLNKFNTLSHTNHLDINSISIRDYFTRSDPKHCLALYQFTPVFILR